VNDATRLRTGTVVHKGVLMTTMLALGTLADSARNGNLGAVLALSDAVSLARDPGYTLFPSCEESLNRCGLLQDGAMHDAIRDVILAATEGDGMDLQIVSPLDGDGPP